MSSVPSHGLGCTSQVPFHGQGLTSPVPSHTGSCVLGLFLSLRSCVFNLFSWPWSCVPSLFIWPVSWVLSLFSWLGLQVPIPFWSLLPGHSWFQNVCIWLQHTLHAGFFVNLTFTNVTGYLGGIPTALCSVHNIFLAFFPVLFLIIYFQVHSFLIISILLLNPSNELFHLKYFRFFSLEFFIFHSFYCPVNHFWLTKKNG